MTHSELFEPIFQAIQAGPQGDTQVLAKELVVIENELIGQTEIRLASRLDLLDRCPIACRSSTEPQPDYVQPRLGDVRNRIPCVSCNRDFVINKNIASSYFVSDEFPQVPPDPVRHRSIVFDKTGRDRCFQPSEDSLDFVQKLDKL